MLQINLHIQFQHQRRRWQKLHDIIPAAMERKIICIILFRQQQRRRQKFIIQFQQQQRKRSVVWEMDHYVANVVMKTQEEKRTQEGWQDRESSWFVYNSGNPTPTFNSFTCCISSMPFLQFMVQFWIDGFISIVVGVEV